MLHPCRRSLPAEAAYPSATAASSAAPLGGAHPRHSWRAGGGGRSAALPVLRPLCAPSTARPSCATALPRAPCQMSMPFHTPLLLPRPPRVTGSALGNLQWKRERSRVAALPLLLSRSARLPAWRRTPPFPAGATRHLFSRGEGHGSDTTLPSHSARIGGLSASPSRFDGHPMTRPPLSQFLAEGLVARQTGDRAGAVCPKCRPSHAPLLLPRPPRMPPPAPFFLRWGGGVGRGATLPVLPARSARRRPIKHPPLFPSGAPLPLCWRMEKEVAVRGKCWTSLPDVTADPHAPSEAAPAVAFLGGPCAWRRRGHPAGAACLLWWPSSTQLLRRRSPPSSFACWGGRLCGDPSGTPFLLWRPIRTPHPWRRQPSYYLAGVAGWVCGDSSCAPHQLCSSTLVAALTPVFLRCSPPAVPKSSR